MPEGEHKAMDFSISSLWNSMMTQLSIDSGNENGAPLAEVAEKEIAQN
jgi:hypothetical protein